MRTLVTIVVVIAVVVGVASSAAADAQPSSMEPAQPKAYVGVSGMAGIWAAGIAVEGGLHLGSGVWARAEVLYGAVGMTEVQDWSGPVVQLRVGLEDRTCTASRHLCGVLGVDVGGQRFHEMFYDHSNGTPDMIRTELVLVPRVALDAGGEHVRARLGLELAQFLDHIIPGEPSGYLAVTAGVAVQW